MDQITRKIAEYSSASTFSDLTDETRHAATQRLIDSLACALGAYDCEPAQIGRRLAAGQVPDKYPGRVLCFGERLPADIQRDTLNTTLDQVIAWTNALAPLRTS